MEPSEHTIKPPHALSDEDLALKCLENPGYSPIGVPYHLEREQRINKVHRRTKLMATVAAVGASASLLLITISILSQSLLK